MNSHNITAFSNQELEQEVVEQKALVSCPHCSRTFLPERLEIHLRSCKAERPLKKRMDASKRGQMSGQPKQMQYEQTKKSIILSPRQNHQERIRPKTTMGRAPVGEPKTVHKRKKSVHFPDNPVVPIDDSSYEASDASDKFSPFQQVVGTPTRKNSKTPQKTRPSMQDEKPSDQKNSKWRQERDAFIKAMRVSKKIDQIEKDGTIGEADAREKISVLQN